SLQTLFAQIPPGYYTSVNGLGGDDLKAELNNIIKDHVKFPYTSNNSIDVWDIIIETDRDPNNPNNVILLYTGWSINGPNKYDGGNGWNREHVWAKSHGDFGTGKGPGTDVHALRACDIDVNAKRSNRWFGNCSESYIQNGVVTGSYLSLTEWLWQPRDEVKGDVARMIFYMATRYEGHDGEVDLEVIDYLPSSNSTPDPVHARLTDLLEWHLEDPVDDWERNRNDIIYNDYQKNRNPFIDHPEFAHIIWGDTNIVADTGGGNNGDGGDNDSTSTSSLSYETVQQTKELLKVIDMTGRETEPKANMLLIYIYSDGTREKRVTID
ncbi:MAG TPA: endonuclease, partial [Brumimicrobium sp.]|nr:endonuclease [Brumimicrobium sp.]